MKNFLKGLITFGIVTVLILEVFFRFVLNACERPRSIQLEDELIFAFDTSSSRTGLYTYGRYCHPGGRWRINSSGWLSVYDYEPRTDLERLRVAIIGDSFVEGFQVDAEDRLDAGLSTKLSNADVYSFGHSGAQLAQYCALTGYIEERWNPDVYVILLEGTDVSQCLDGYSYYFGAEVEESSVSMRLPDHYSVQYPYGQLVMRFSAVARYLWLNAGFGGIVQGGIGSNPVNEENPESHVDSLSLSVAEFLLDEMLKNAPDDYFILAAIPLNGGGTSTSGEPGLTPAASALLQVSEGRQGLVFVDLGPALSTAERESASGIHFDFHNDSHWNETGVAAVTDTLAYVIGNVRRGNSFGSPCN